MSEQVAEAKIESSHSAKGFQFGVRQLLMYFVFVAVSFGLLKAPYPLLSTAVKTVVIGTLITAILLAIYQTGRLRAFWIGFAVVGSIYFYLTSISDSFRSQSYMSMPYVSYPTSYAQPYSNEETYHILPNWILAKAYTYMGVKLQPYPPATVPAPMPPVRQSTFYQPQSDANAQADSAAQLATPDSNPASAQPATPPPYNIAPAYAVPQTYAPLPVYGSATLTAQPNGTYAMSVATIPWPIFLSNGQCIFTILFAYIGGMFAQWLYVKREIAR